MPLATVLVAMRDQVGLVARLAGFFADRGLNIVDASNHTDPSAERDARFFMRLVVDLGEHDQRRTLEAELDALVRGLGGTWSVGYSDVIARVAILVTKEPACLYDLLLRQRAGELACEIPLIVSNHPTLQPVAESFGVPFVTLPVTRETRREQEERLRALLAEQRIELVVLARYMQVLTPELLAGAPPIINIHHGFLPSFQGARPYHQAHERGVKMIGATAHYVTPELDDGPIIEQDVARVGHHMGPDEMARVGQDVERVVLARAVRAHLERRILVEGRRTILL